MSVRTFEQMVDEALHARRKAFDEGTFSTHVMTSFPLSHEEYLVLLSTPLEFQRTVVQCLDGKPCCLCGRRLKVLSQTQEPEHGQG